MACENKAGVTAGAIRFAQRKSGTEAWKQAQLLAEKQEAELRKLRKEVEQENKGTFWEWSSRKRKEILSQGLRKDHPLMVWASFAFPYSYEYDAETKPGKTVLMMKDSLGKTVVEKTVNNDESKGSKEVESFLRLVDRTKDRYHEACLILIRQYAEYLSGNDK